jgi:hypothetical protein
MNCDLTDFTGGDSKWSESFRLTAFVPLALREQHVYRLFDIVPGLELCRLIHEPRSVSLFVFSPFFVPNINYFKFSCYPACTH